MDRDGHLDRDRTVEGVAHQTLNTIVPLLSTIVLAVRTLGEGHSITHLIRDVESIVPLLSAIALAVHTLGEGHFITHLNRDVESVVPLLSLAVLTVRTLGEGHSIALSNTKRYQGFAH